MKYSRLQLASYNLTFFINARHANMILVRANKSMEIKPKIVSETIFLARDNPEKRTEKNNNKNSQFQDNFGQKQKPTEALQFGHFKPPVGKRQYWQKNKLILCQLVFERAKHFMNKNLFNNTASILVLFLTPASCDKNVIYIIYF